MFKHLTDLTNSPASKSALLLAIKEEFADVKIEPGSAGDSSSSKRSVTGVSTLRRSRRRLFDPDESSVGGGGLDAKEEPDTDGSVFLGESARPES